MNLNWLFIPTVAMGIACYVLGRDLGIRIKSKIGQLILGLLFLLLALPALAYAAYYTGWLGEPLWLYRLRAFPGSELLASLFGLIVGWLTMKPPPEVRQSRVLAFVLGPIVLLLGLSVPYVKQIVSPLNYHHIRNLWAGDACLQSTEATCGPAAAATILRKFSQKTNERNLAEESFSTRTGTENWYLARVLRRRGCEIEYVAGDQPPSNLPAIAGVRLKTDGQAGHFIALLGNQDGSYVVADPLKGMATNSLSELRAEYEFTGFYMLIARRSL